LLVRDAAHWGLLASAECIAHLGGRPISPSPAHPGESKPGNPQDRHQP
jgi:hypothetical protein